MQSNSLIQSAVVFVLLECDRRCDTGTMASQCRRRCTCVFSQLLTKYCQLCKSIEVCLLLAMLALFLQTSLDLAPRCAIASSLTHPRPRSPPPPRKRCPPRPSPAGRWPSPWSPSPPACCSLACCRAPPRTDPSPSATWTPCTACTDSRCGFSCALRTWAPPWRMPRPKTCAAPAAPGRSAKSPTRRPSCPTDGQPFESSRMLAHPKPNVASLLVNIIS